MKSPFLRRFGMPSPFFDNEAGFSPTVLLTGSTAFLWYDPSDLPTLFQNAAGTTPVTAPAQPVGLVLDKSQGLVLGPELVTNGDFSNGMTGWSGSWTASGGVAVGTPAGAALTGGGFTATAGRTYLLQFDILATNFLSVSLGGTSLGNFFSAQTVRRYVQAASASGVSFAAGGSINTQIDNISVRELPGNHATQATAASRPTYGIVPSTGRRNLLTYTEQFDNAAWTIAEATVVANAGTSPVNDATADKLREASGAISFAPRATQTFTGFTSGLTYTASTYAKTDGRNWVRLELPASAFGANTWAWFNISTGAVGTTNNTPATTVENIGSGWYRLSISKAATITASGGAGIRFSNADNTLSYTGDGTSGILIWGAQLETGSTATAYQRVGSAFDVTEAGVPSLSYLSFDGIDDFLVTPTITPGIDKAQVFAGVRKLSDPDDAILAELGTGSQNGSFYLGAPVNAKTWRYSLQSRGTTAVNANVTAAGFAAPVTTVVSGLADISGDVAIIRANGVQQAQVTTDQGTGNFLAYPLYIGRRGGTSLPFNGQLYGLITRFSTANLDASVISQTERWMGGKTGVTIA